MPLICKCVAATPLYLHVKTKVRTGAGRHAVDCIVAACARAHSGKVLASEAQVCGNHPTPTCMLKEQGLHQLPSAHGKGCGALCRAILTCVVAAGRIQ